MAAWQQMRLGMNEQRRIIALHCTTTSIEYDHTARDRQGVHVRSLIERTPAQADRGPETTAGPGDVHQSVNLDPCSREGA